MDAIVFFLKTILGYQFWFHIGLIICIQGFGRVLLEWLSPGTPYRFRKVILGISILFGGFNFIMLIACMLAHAPIVILIKYLFIIIPWCVLIILDTYGADRFSGHVPQSTIHNTSIPDHEGEHGGVIEITKGQGILPFGIYTMGDKKEHKAHGVFAGFNTRNNTLRIPNENNSLVFQLSQDKMTIGFNSMILYLEIDIDHLDDVNKFNTEEQTGEHYMLERIQEEAIDALGVRVGPLKSEDVDDAQKIKALIEHEDAVNKKYSLAHLINEDLKKLEIQYYKVKHVRIDKPISDPRYLQAKGQVTVNAILNEAERKRTEGQLENALLINDEEAIKRLRALLAANGTSESFYGLDGADVRAMVNANAKK